MELSPIDATIENIQNDKFRAWAYFDADTARKNGEGAQKRPGKLNGVAVGVKDIYNTYDMPTQMGSPIWKDFTPGNDARVVHNIRMAGGVIVGKTVTAEFAVHTPGPTLNPHNAEYMAGTSSTGSAVAVATEQVPLALGSQTAGSIIRPASYNGVLGFKPSFGLVPRTGMLKTTDTLDTVGMFAVNVEMMRLLFDVIRVQGADYPFSKLEEKLGDLRAFVIQGPLWDDAEDYVIEVMTGLEYESILAPLFLNEIHELHGMIYDKTLAYYFQAEAKKKKLVSPKMYEIIEQGKEVTLHQYNLALEKQAVFTQLFDKWMRMSKIDILLDFSTAGTALKGVNSEDRPDHCLIWTFLGLPVINVPLFTGPNGMPFGLQVIGRKYGDYDVLNFAKELMQ